MSALPDAFRQPLLEACASDDDIDWDAGESETWGIASGALVERGLTRLRLVVDEERAQEVEVADATELGRLAARWLL